MEEKVDEQKIIKIIESMGTFMKQTNEVLAGQRLQIENLQLDVKNLKKDNRKILVS